MRAQTVETFKYYASDGWSEPDNKPTKNVLRTVSQGQENYLFFGSDHGGDPEGYLRHAQSVITDWSVNSARELMPWRVLLPWE